MVFKPFLDEFHWKQKSKREKIARLHDWAVATDEQLNHESRELSEVKEEIKKLKVTIYDPPRVTVTPGLVSQVKHLEEEIRLLKTYLKVDRDDRPEQKRMAPVKKGRK